MDVIEYSYKASDLLLKELYKYTNDNKLKELLEPFSLLEDKKTDISWSMISTALLMSENILKGMPVLKKGENYNNYPIHEQTIALLLDHWINVRREMDNCVLDDNDNKIVSLNNFIDYYENMDIYNELYKRIVKNFDRNFEIQQRLDEEAYNDYIIESYFREHHPDYDRIIDMDDNDYINEDDPFDNYPDIEPFSSFGNYEEIYNKYFGDSLSNEPRKDIINDITWNSTIGYHGSSLPVPCMSSVKDKDGKVDLRVFMFRVRCALAHSEFDPMYDVAHLYHHINSNKKDFNILLDTDSVMYFMDDVNETAYDFYNSIDFIKSEYATAEEKHFFIINKFKNELEKKRLDENEITELLTRNLNISKEKCESIIKKIRNRKYWKNPIDYIEKDEKKYDDVKYTIEEKNYEYNSNRIYSIIKHIPFKNIDLLTNLGTIINYYYYSDKKGYITEEYEKKAEYYDYLQSSDLFRTAYATKKDESFKQELMKILIISYLNTILSTNYNVALNKESMYYGVEITFEGLEIDDNQLKNEIDKKKIKYQNLITKIEEQITSKENKYKEKYGERKRLIRQLKACNDLEIKGKAERIEAYNKKRALLKSIYDDRKLLYKAKEDIFKELDNLDANLNKKDKTAYIIKSIRDSISHGHIEFNENDINANTIIKIRDYDEEDNLTFEGKISIYNLLKTVIENKDKFYQDRIDKKKIKQ